MVEWLMALISLVLSMDTSWPRSGCCESCEGCRESCGCGVTARGSGMVFMPSLSDWDWVILGSWGTDIDLVTSLGMGDKERSREGVMLPDP
jgi:hypothetical protein